MCNQLHNRALMFVMVAFGTFYVSYATAGLIQDIFGGSKAEAPTKELADLPAGRSYTRHGRRHFSRHYRRYAAPVPRRSRVIEPAQVSTPRADPVAKPPPKCEPIVIYEPIEDIEARENAEAMHKLDVDDVKHGRRPTWAGTIPAFKPTTSER